MKSSAPLQSADQSLEPRTAPRQQPTRTIDSPYLSSQEAVQYLRCGTLSSLYRLVTEHGLPYSRKGSRYFFDKRRIDNWVSVQGSGVSLAKRRA